MNKKILSFFLAWIMILSCIPTGMIHAQGNEKIENPILLDLKKQAGKKYDLEDKIEVIVEIDEETMANKYGLNIPNMENLKDDGGMQAQIEYAKKSQSLLLDRMDEEGIDHRVTMTYKTLLNGFATEILYKDALKLAELDEVLSLKISEKDQILAPQEPTFLVKNSFRSLRAASTNNEMVRVNDVWVKYSGKGQLVAVIDSGADPEHPEFKSLSHGKYVIEDVKALEKTINEKGISNGKFYSNKIPFGFNYYDRNTRIKQGSRYSHGQHVAGIVGANGEKMTGVAPDAQLAILRVFGDSSLGTTAAIYNKAIDDAVLLGADAINMSLGSTALSDSRVEASTRKAFENAKKAGIVISAAAGNEGFMGWGAIKNPKSTTPDYGLINSPSVLDVAMSVASINNTQIRKQGMIVNDGTGKNIQYSIGNGEPTDRDVQIVHVNYGYEEDVPESVKGKYALIQRGFKEGKTDDFTFEQKVKNVQEKGAIGAIIYNNSAENFSMSFQNKPNIPAVLISKDSGEYLVSALEKNPNVTVKFKKEFEVFNNVDGYKMSAFSSWGLSPEGNLKPDITAPGGDIYSTVNTEGNLEPYDVMSGTSMAAPHVAGGIAIVKQYVMNELQISKGEEIHKVVKNLLMSTATPILNDANKGTVRVSPRNQGAGLMNLKEATRSKVTIEGTNEVSSINLRNIEGNKLIISGKLHNYGDELERFTYKTEVNTDTVENNVVLLKPKNVAVVEGNTIEVGPKQTVDFKIEIDIAKEKMEELSKEMPKGFFLEGFVFFDNSDSNKADLSVPFV